MIESQPHLDYFFHLQDRTTVTGLQRRIGLTLVCLLAVELLALALEENESMLEILYLRVGPLDLLDDKSNGITGATLLLHEDTRT